MDGLLLLIFLATDDFRRMGKLAALLIILVASFAVSLFSPFGGAQSNIVLLFV